MDAKLAAGQIDAEIAHATQLDAIGELVDARQEQRCAATQNRSIERTGVKLAAKRRKRRHAERSSLLGRRRVLSFVEQLASARHNRRRRRFALIDAKRIACIENRFANLRF